MNALAADIEEKIFKGFSERVEEYSVQHDVPLLESILHYCDDLGIEYDDVKKHLNENLITKLKVEMCKERRIKVDLPNQLPI